MTIVRFIGGPLVTAMVGTVVQTQQKLHYTRLAEQVIPGTPIGQMLSFLQAKFQAGRMDLFIANSAAITELIRVVQRQAYALVPQDGYRLTFWLLIPAVLAVLFVRGQGEGASQSRSTSLWQRHPMKKRLDV